MKVFICILVLAISTANAGFLQKSRGQQKGYAGPPRQARPLQWQARTPQVINVFHSQAQSNPHANAQGSPVKIVKVFQQSGPSVADLRSSNAAPAKIIRVIHHDDAANGGYGRSAGSQDAKIVKVFRDSSANSYAAPEEQDVKVYKVFKQNGGGWSSSSASSYGSGHASGYSQGQSAPAAVVKVINVVDKQSEYAPRSKW